MKQIDISTLLDYRYLSNLSASPDKKKCVFVVNKCDSSTNSYVSYVYIYDTEKKSIKQITHEGKEKEVIWLDNDTILFSSVKDETSKKLKADGEPWTSYYAIKIDGSKEYEFMRLPLEINWIKAMGENKFAITANCNIDENKLINGSAQERSEYYESKRKRERSYDIADEIPFRKESKGVTNGDRTRAFIYDKSKNKLTPISDELQNVEFIGANEKRVIYSAKRFTKNEPYMFKSGISIYDVEKEKLSELIDDNTYRVRFCDFMNDIPVFMGADGLKYGYQENANFFYINEEDGKEKIFVSNNLSVINGVGTDIRYGGLSTEKADDYSIYYISTEGGSSYIKRANFDGTVEKLTDKYGSVDSIEVCDGEIIFIGMRDNKLQELYSLKNGVEKQLTEFNEWVHTDYTVSMTEVLEFENEDTKLEGWVIKPVNYQKGKKYPGILYIHGGHKLAFGPIYFHEMQVWANQDFFVFYCNPRGSESEDNDFANIIGKYGYIDGSDIMKFTDECVKKYPELDENRLGVGGGSYGGYMTNWLIGHTHRFKCAVSQRGISNFISQFGTSDTAYQFPMWQFDTDIWMDVNRYWDHSPLKYANNCKTPTLFIHSENDFRCPISQGIEMFYALKYNGVESRLCMFKNESHELSRSGRPENRINRLTEITNWFVKYLK